MVDDAPDVPRTAVVDPEAEMDPLVLLMLDASCFTLPGKKGGRDRQGGIVSVDGYAPREELK